MASINSVDLSTYTLVGRYDLPEPTRTPAPANSLLAQEVSAVTYNPDTDTLFVLGDGGTSIVQVTKTGQLIDSMTLAPGSSPQGTTFYDPEGLTYIGGGKFVLVEERDRQAVSFTYVPGTTLTRASTQTVKLGTTIGNIGLEGITYDPQTGGFILVKEENPEGIFQTNIDFAAGTATNGSPTTVNSINLFDPAKAGLLDFADVYALSNVPSLNGQPDSSHLLVLSQASGQIVEVDRAGNVFSSLTIVSNPGNPLSVPDQQHEGLTIDKDGILYVTSENGGGDINHPQLWVYAPSTVPNQAPTAVTLTSPIVAIAENTSTAARLKVAGIAVADDGLGTNNLTVTGADASFFEVDSNGLYIKAGTTLDYETKTSYSVTVNVNDPTVGGNPDASTTYTLSVTDVVNEAPALPASLIISEVAPWASGNSPYAADWFEVTNTGTSAVDITGWKIDDNSNAFASAVALNGVTSIAPGKSVIFIESTTPDATIAAFKAAWFGSNAPSDLTIGTYSGSGVGLSTGGDAVNLFDASGNRVTGINFGTSTTGLSFNNTAGLGSTTLPLPTVSTLSTPGVNGAFLAADGIETGSPGSIASSVTISEISPWSSGNSAYAADWFEVTNTGTSAADLTGWRIDDNSNAFASSVALRGVTRIPVGKSAIFIEGDATGSTDAAIVAAFSTAWFGSATPPAGFLIGTYGGSGVGLSTGGDAVNLFDSIGNRITGVSFGPSTTFSTFDNTAGLGSTTLPLPVVSTLSAVGVNAIRSANGLETGSPGAVDKAPTAIALTNPIIRIAENTSTTTRIKVADIAITDDGLGKNTLSVSGTDASFFEVDSTGLYIKAGTSLDYETKDRYNLTVNVDDAIVGSTPDATAVFSLGVTNVNDLASISGNAAASVKEGTNVTANGKLTISGSLTVTDQDAGQNKFAPTVTPDCGNLGSLTISETGAYTYTVDNSAVQYLGAGQTKVENFTVTSLDGTASQTIAVTINGVTASYSGVAAGDATSNSAILWTRTVDTATKQGITENVSLQLSTDANFATVRSIDGVTRDANHDYTLKIDATGLQSGTKYYYRFQSAGGELSSVGTFKTAPDATAQTAVRFGFSGDADGLMRPYPSTQNFPNLNLDYFVFLGDTIYETASTGSPAAANPITNPAQALIDYHRKYLENIQPVNPGGFASLQTLFASQGNYTVLDNHELGNKQLINGGAPSALATLAGNGSSNPADDVNRTGTFINDTIGFNTLVQAYSDYQPIREKIISAPNDARTDGTQQLYLAQQWGQNVVYINTDTRSYRDVRLKDAAGADDTGARADNPDRTLLGATQLAWVKQNLLDAQANGTTWKFVSVSDPIDQIGAIGSGADSGKSWIGGYRAERNDLLKFIADNGIKNVVFLATDDHQNRVNELTYTDNGVVKVLPNALSVVDGPIGATGPDVITNHSFSNIKALADTLAAAQIAAGVNPIGLAKDFYGLSNVVRDGDPNADTLRQPIDFYSPDTYNYTVFDISPDGKTLKVNVQGINSYAQNTFPEPSAANSGALPAQLQPRGCQSPHRLSVECHPHQ